MRPAPLLGLFLSCLPVHAQTATVRPESYPQEDPGIRAEAVRLLERANHVCTPPAWPPNEMTLRFRVGKTAPGEPVQGEYVSSFGGPGLRRQEWRYGAYQPIQIRNGNRLSISGNTAANPAILQLLPQLTPIYLVRFDSQDIVRSITDQPDSRCIQFETVFGDRQQAGEICVDSKNGWPLSVRQGDMRTLNSEFFPFAGAFLPGHVERWTGNTKLIEIDETVIAKDDYPPDFFSVPETATGFICQDFRRAFAVNTPQPTPQTASLNVIDIKLQGLIGYDGRVTDLKPIEQTYPDLNNEAIKLVATWTYRPAMCGGRPAVWGTVFTVHFKGR